jgi:hypothetical protein
MAVFDTRVIEGHQARILQRREQPHLALKPPLIADVRAREEKLDRNRPVEHGVDGPIHVRGAATAQPLSEVVPPRSQPPTGVAVRHAVLHRLLRS